MDYNYEVGAALPIAGRMKRKNEREDETVRNERSGLNDLSQRQFLVERVEAIDFRDASQEE